MVTRAGQDIGPATAEALAEVIALVVVTDMNGDMATQAAETLRAASRWAELETLYVTDRAELDAICALRRAERACRHLSQHTGIAISNKFTETRTDEVWQKVIDVNRDCILCYCRAFGKIILERNAGAIVNLGSMSGYIVKYPQEQAQHNASKTAAHHLNEIARRRVGRERCTRERGGAF